MKKKILITGGCGFIGANLCIHLKNLNFAVDSIDNLSRRGSRYKLGILKKNGIKNYKFNIEDYNKLKLLPRYDIIIDCCAEAAVEVSKKNIDQVINTNLIGTLKILNKAKRDKSKVIFLSTSRVYSISKINNLFKNNNFKNKLKVKTLIDEKFDTDSPMSIYGVTKLSSELFIKEFSYAFGLKYIINRFGVVSGPLQFGKEDQGFVSLWIWRHITKKKLNYIGYNGLGNQVRDILHIDDLCKIIEIQIRKINTINNKVFTVGGSRKNTISLNNLTKICEKVTKNKIKFGKIKLTSIYDIPYFVTSNKKITNTYNWKPKKNMFDIINDTYKWMINKKHKIKNYM